MGGFLLAGIVCLVLGLACLSWPGVPPRYRRWRARRWLRRRRVHLVRPVRTSRVWGGRARHH